MNDMSEVSLGISVRAIVFGVLGVCLAMIYAGGVLSYLWGWFVVPMGVTPITPQWGCGLMIIVALLKGMPDGDGNDSISTVLFKSFSLTTAALALGAVLHFYFM